MNLIYHDVNVGKKWCSGRQPWGNSDESSRSRSTLYGTSCEMQKKSKHEAKIHSLRRETTGFIYIE